MSASKDKINRKQLRESGQDKHVLAQQKAEAERRKTRTKYGIVAAIVVVVFAFIFVFNSAIPSRSLTGATIDGQDYSVAQLNYYYSNSYQNFYSTYYQYIQYGLFFDANTSLGDQDYSEDMTWREYFLDQALENMKQVQALCAAGEAEGFELPEEYQTQYDQAVADLQTTWQTSGYSSLKQFLNLVYGKGVDEQMVKDEMYRSVYASAYAEHIYESYEYTPEELSAYYGEHADEYDLIDYAVYSAAVDEEDESVKTGMEALVAAVNGKDVEAFETYVAENYEGDTINNTSAQGANLSAAYSEWLLDGARQSGDCELIESNGMFYAVMYLDRDSNQYQTRAFRHVLIMAEDTDGDEVITETEVQAATDRAEEILAEWKAGEATEDSFAALANLYSEDTGSNTTGGLYEDVYKGQMVPPVNDWLFDTAATTGDTAVVTYNEGGSYTGAHALYYVGESGEVYADQLADAAMRSEAATGWLEEMTGAMNATLSNTGIAAKNY